MFLIFAAVRDSRLWQLTVIFESEHLVISSSTELEFAGFRLIMKCYLSFSVVFDLC